MRGRYTTRRTQLVLPDYLLEVDNNDDHLSEEEFLPESNEEVGEDSCESESSGRAYTLRSRASFSFIKDDVVKISKTRKRVKPVEFHQVPRKNTKIPLSELEEAIEIWEDINREYRSRLNEFIANGLLIQSEERILVRKIDTALLASLFDIFKIIYTAAFGSSTTQDVEEMIESLKDCNQTTSVKVICVIDGWTQILCNSSVFACIQQLVCLPNSPFMFILHSQLCQDIVLRERGLKCLSTDSNFETVLLVPARDGWHHLLFQQFESSNTTPAKMLPSHPFGCLTGKDLLHMRHIPRYSVNSSVPSTKCVVEFRNLAYNMAVSK